MKRVKERRICAFVLALVFMVSSLTVTVSASENVPCISTGEVMVEDDESIRVPIRISNNPGIIALLIRVNFDGDMLELTEIENGTVFSKSTVAFSRDLSTNPYGILWEDGLATSDNTNNGILATMIFRIKDGSTVDRSEIKIEVDEESTFDTELKSIGFKTDVGTVSRCILWAKNGSVINYQKRTIYGLPAGLKSLDDYVFTKEGIELGNRSEDIKVWGTGRVLQLLSNAEVLEEYTVTIFGDVNGDSWYDGQDSVMVSMIANGMLTRDQVGETAWVAADCNHDGRIDMADVDLLNQAGIFLANVDQLNQ